MSTESHEPEDMYLPSLSANAQPAETSNHNLTLSGLIGIEDEPEISAPAPSRLKSRTSGMLMVVVVAAGALLMMRQLGLGTGLTMSDVKINYPFGEGEKADARAHHDMLANLRHSSVTAQVPLKNVKKNPFLLGLSNEVVAAPSDKPANPFDKKDYERQQRRQLIRSTLAGLKLNSVLGGSVSVARISGQNVRIGDTVAGLFVVKSIHGRTVDLSVDGEVYALVMGK